MVDREESKSNAQSNARHEEVQQGGQHPRVLIAEDDWAFRDLLLWAFEDNGYDVVTVNSGTELLKKLESSLPPGASIKAFDLVVSDVRMPGWSGLTALENLNSTPSVPPIVIITAYGSQEIHERAKHAGAVALLEKPFEISDLTDLAARSIAQHRALQGCNAIAEKNND